MMKHQCKPITFGHSVDEVCGICNASLALPSYDELVEAIQRVRELHIKVITLCTTCEELYPCPTIEALDGEK